MADISGNQVTVFGGSGFIGRHLVRHLAAEGHTIRVAVRHPERCLFLKVMGKVGHIVPVAADVCEPHSVQRAVAGSQWVINLVGILAQSRKRTFQRVHVEGAANVAKAAALEGAQRLVHVSALGADAAAQSVYARTKAEGEVAVRAAFPAATILRPNAVFGPEDQFFNLFAAIAQVSPILPVLGASGTRDGGARFQPVYVGDVADAIMAALKRDDAIGGTYELCGPEVMDARKIMQDIARHTGRRRLLIPAPYWLLSLKAFFLEKLPGKLLTRDQVKMLRVPKVAGAAKGLADLGIQLTAPEAILPSSLSRFRRPAPRRLPRVPAPR
jgi:NADH dehydrogenase